MRCSWLVLALVLAGCLRSNSVSCPDGRTCPQGDACDTIHQACVRPEQLTSCADKLSGDACDITEAGDGICDQGVCIPAGCGDGYRRGDEACDGSDIPATVTCQSRGFYDPGAVSCNSACGIDDSACTGFCGDGIVTPGHEVCEPGIDPVLSCVDFGFGAGVLGCNMCAPGLADCRRFGWDHAQLPFTTTDVHGTSDSNVFVIGAGGIVHFDGMGWGPVDLSGCFGAGPVPSFNAVWSIGDRDAFVTGPAGLVMHLTSGGCSVLPAPTSAGLGAVWASSASDVYVLESGGVWHFDGTSWTEPLTGSYVSIWGASATDVFVLDSSNSVTRYTGTWSTPEAIPGMSYVNAIWGTSPTDVFAGGNDPSGKAYVSHFDGTSWTPSFNSGAAFGASSSMIVAGAAGGRTQIGTGFMITTDVVPVMMIGDGTGWTRLTPPTSWIAKAWVSPAGTAYLVDPQSAYVSVLSQLRLDAVVGTEGKPWRLAARSSSEVFAGGALPGNGYRWNGFSWINDSPGTSLIAGVGPAGETYGLSLSGGQGMFVYTPGTGTWSLAKAGPLGDALAVLGTNDVWYIAASSGPGAVIHWNGTYTTTTQSFKDRDGNDALMTDICRTGPTHVFTAGQHGTIGHFDGTSWETQVPPTTDDLTGVWGAAPDDVYAWSATTLLHYDGTAWTAMSLPASASPTSVWAGSPTDVFVATSNRGLLRYNGSRWAPVDIGTTLPLSDIEGIGESLFVSDATGAVHQLLRTTTW